MNWTELDPTKWLSSFAKVRADDPVLYYVVIVSLVTAFIVVPLIRTVRKK